MSRRGSSGSGRNLRQKVASARGRKISSTRWLDRQLNDPYVKRAGAEGMRSRSAYKLLEIDDRYHLLKKGCVVVDLGAAPGGWSQVTAARVGSSAENILVVGIDYLEMDPLPAVTILQKDFLDNDAPALLAKALNGRAPDIVLSDMAAPTTGHRKTDHIRTMHLCEVAADFAISVLKPGGHFLAKTFRGGTEGQLLAVLKNKFSKVYHVKPPASRPESVEMYLLAMDFRNM